MPITTGGVAFYNQKFIDTKEHFDTFIQNRVRKHPRYWFDRVPRGSLSLFEGLVRQTNIFHGPIGEQSGLSNWDKIQTSRPANGATPAFNACDYDPKTFGHAFEPRSYSGFRCSWQSMPICLNDIRFLEEGKQQAMYVASSLAYITQSVWENWNREQYVYQAVDNGNAMVFTEGGVDFLDNANVRFSYDPFATDANGNAYLTAPKGLKIAPLSWGFFDFLQDYLGDECPEAALAMDAGLPLFGVMAHMRDVTRAIEADSKIYETYRYANAKAMLEDYRSMVFDKFKGWLFTHDGRQMRFNATKVDGDNLVYTRVNPLREGRQVVHGAVPEANPEYHKAEYALGVILINDVLMNLIPNTISSLGAGMTFGAVPGLNGDFRWINEYDRQLNPLREVGFFFARFESFPKPGMYANRAIAFLYRRCPQINVGTCDLGTAGVAASGTAVALAAAAVAGDVDATNKTITVTLAKKLACQTGSVTLALPEGATSPTAGFILDGTQAPTYVIGFASGTLAAADFTTAATVVCG
jgi:hypothetical protein